MKRRILDGSFTPNSNNRNTHWDSYFGDKKFRSSWEAIYYSLNSGDLYESLRIKYIYENKEHIYIVDFVNHITRIATEIKPKKFLVKDRERLKIESLELWCEHNNYKMNIITEDDIQQMCQIIDIEKFDSNTQKKIKALNEAYKKNRNR